MHRNQSIEFFFGGMVGRWRHHVIEAILSLIQWTPPPPPPPTHTAQAAFSKTAEKIYENILQGVYDPNNDVSAYMSVSPQQRRECLWMDEWMYVWMDGWMDGWM